MKIIKTKIKDLFVIELEPKIDERGYFVRTFCADELKKSGIKFNIVQANQSLTKRKGTIRGMHYQLKPKSDGKIVQCLMGRIYDVAIDLRPKSPTYKKWFGIELSGDGNKILLIPKGFAHGFQTLTNDCFMQYLMSEFYSLSYYRGVRWNDPAFKIKWPIANPHVSEQDSKWPLI